jgi:predicted RND superfamily exporter protein
VRDYRYLPDSRQAVAQMLLLHDSLKTSDGMAAFVDAHQRYYRLPVPLPTLRRSVYEGYMDRIRAYLDRELPELKVDQTGMVQLFATMDAYVLETTQVSFSLAFGVIIVLLLVILRSARLGLLAIVPNTFPLLLAGGLLAALDISLDFGTTVIASITFGLVVDDTIHFLVRMRQRLAAGDGLRAALRHTYEHVGSAIVITSVVIALAFGLYLFGAFGPSMRLGAFSALIILLACVADLVIVPALFFVFYPGRVEQEDPR